MAKSPQRLPDGLWFVYKHLWLSPLYLISWRRNISQSNIRVSIPSSTPPPLSISSSLLILFCSATAPHRSYHPTGEMAWPFRSKQALITSWERIVGGDGPRRLKGATQRRVGLGDRCCRAAGCCFDPLWEASSTSWWGSACPPWVSVSRTARGGGGGRTGRRLRG